MGIGMILILGVIMLIVFTMANVLAWKWIQKQEEKQQEKLLMNTLLTTMAPPVPTTT